MKKYIRKADIILFIVLVVIGLASTAFVLMSKSAGTTVYIESAGELYGKYSLFEDKEIKVELEGSKAGAWNTVVIKDGEVYVEKASCHNQVCVNSGRISQSGESIICLPNKLVVRIEGKGGGDYDAVSN